MAKSAKQIIADIDAHLSKSSAKYYKDFYVGITEDINERLFDFHQVPKKSHWYIYREATSDKESRAVEKHYLDKGMDGGDGGGDDDAVYVYCYRISNETKER